MENYSNYSYPDSRDSSPRSREIDCENPSWDEQPSSYKAKFMCSYGGKIQPRAHDNQLAYVGGDTKILAVDRNIKLQAFLSKLSSISDSPEVCFKYQLPGEDLDALISVTNDEDLDHMMMEYDRLYRASAKPARLRLFLFPLNPPVPTGFGSPEAKSERQWFVDALNSVQIQPLEGSSPPASAAGSGPGSGLAPPNPDFLFGFDKGYPGQKFTDSMAAPPPAAAAAAPDSIAKDVTAGSDCGSEDRHVVGEPLVSPAEMQRQIQELQRMQISHHQEQQAMFQRNEIPNPRAYTGEYYSQKVPAPAQIPATYVSDRHMTTGGYHVAPPAGTEQQPVYLIPTPAGVYQAPGLRPVTGPVGQPYYGVQRMVQEVYREGPVYNAGMGQAQAQAEAQQQQQQQQAKLGNYSEGVPMVQQQKVGVGEAGFAQVGYDSSGRPVYYTTTGGAISLYQTVGVDVRQGGGGGGGGGGALSQVQDGKVVAKASQASAM